MPNFGLEQQVFNALPHAGKAMYDRALLGRIGDKKVSGEEKDIAKHVPYTKKHQYLGARILTNPVVTGIGAAGFAALYHKFHAPMLMRALKHYKSLAKTTHPVGKQLRTLLGNQLRDPRSGTVMTSASQIKAVAQKTPAQARKSALTAGMVTAGVTAVGRYLHPRALKANAIAERELYHEKDPSEYIRTKLRDDVELRRGKGVIKTSAYAFHQTTLPYQLASPILNTMEAMKYGIPARQAASTYMLKYPIGATIGNTIYRAKTWAHRIGIRGNKYPKTWSGFDVKEYLKSAPWNGYEQQIPTKIWKAVETPGASLPGASARLLKGLTDYGPIGTAANLAIPAAGVYGIKKLRDRMKHGKEK